MRLNPSVIYFNNKIQTGAFDDGISLREYLKTELEKQPSYHKSASGRQIVDTERTFVLDLNKCYTQIIKIVRDLGYSDATMDKPCKRLSKGEISYLISDNTLGVKCYKIDIACKNKRRISFCNLNEFFPHGNTWDLEKYDRMLNTLNNTVGLGITPAATARKAWETKLNEVGLHYDFANENKQEIPVLDRNGKYLTLDDYCRHAYGGAWCYCNAPLAQDVGAGIRFDVHSLYPSILKSGVPSDSSYFYTDSLRELKDGFQSGDNIWLIHFKCKFRAKEGTIPFVQLKSRFCRVDDALSSRTTTGEDLLCDMYMFKPEYDMFRKYYDIREFKFIDGICFERTDAGKWYVDEHYNAKEYAKKCGDQETAQMHKLLMNSIIGLFSRKQYGSIMAFNSKMQPVSVHADCNNPSHVAVAAYIVSCGRARLADIANQNRSRFLYCDTDSINLRGIGGGFGIEVGKECGKFGIEGVFDHAVFYGKKKYIEWKQGEAKVTLAGLPVQYSQTIAESLEIGQVVENHELHYNEKEYGLYEGSVEHLLRGEHLDQVAIPYKVDGGKQTLVYSVNDSRDWWKIDRERKNSMRYAAL